MCQTTVGPWDPADKPKVLYKKQNGLQSYVSFTPITLDSPLLLPPQPDSLRTSQGCENDVRAKAIGLKSFSEHRVHSGPFDEFKKLVSRTWDASTSQRPECRNQACERRRSALEKAVPRCGWPSLEALIVRILACWTPNLIHLLQGILLEILPEDGRLVLRDDFNVTKYGLSTTRDVEKLPTSLCLNLDGFVDLDWSDDWRLFEAHEHTYNRLGGLLLTLNPYYEARALKVTEECRRRAACPNRFWNVSLLGSGGIADLPQIASVVLEKPALIEGQDNPHQDCTEQSCLFSHQNTTLVAQCHKCESKDCERTFVYPKDILNKSFKRASKQPTHPSPRSPWTPTAWRTTTDKPSLCGVCERYMAPSHVWIDGTGERGRDSGEVNACLFDYFTDTAEDLGCSGVWWDAISIPTGPARTTAIYSMLTNYERAAVTVVHDQELINFEWSDNGSPPVALILSSWFTRGWTAAEIFASRRHPVKPLVKDLDHDILAWDLKSIGTMNMDDVEALDNFALGLVPRHGHFIATDILRRLRTTGVSGATTISSLRDLLLNLRARVTSWAKDRLIIPGLMCFDESLDSTLAGPQNTRQLLAHFGKTFCTCGPWSWCPQSIFDLGMSQNSLSRRPSGNCTITKDGKTIGEFTACTLTRYDVVIPFGNHPAVACRISDALRDRWSCMLLTGHNDNIQSHRQYILGIPVWVGCVYLAKDNAIVSNDRSEEAVLGPTYRLKLPHHRNNGFLFGKDVDDDGCPLPTMKPVVASTALRGFHRAKFDRNGNCRWVIGTEVEQDGKLQWKRHYQPICLYPRGVSQQLNKNDPEVPISFCAVIDESRDRNALDPSSLAKLPYCVKELPSLLECDINHKGYRGTLILTWSFPNYGPPDNIPIIRRIFRSQFHVMKTDRKDVDIRIGWQTGTNVQVLYSSTTKGSVDSRDWNKPVPEIALSERGVRKVSSSDSLATSKGMTFDKMFRDWKSEPRNS
ncbi:hypothetical protein F4677DRAFT_456726 [Hypoxylon crocopeplum]|nr:hypothetical protein F4677DRAFT_456726 [Hypoxylon crocopeplum]